jgi:hypothetical protein
VFTYRGYVGAHSSTAQRSVHPELNPHGKTRECMNMTPIVVAMDVTRSRGDDSRAIYAKLPMFIGQIELRNYVPGPAISFAAIGDATSGDRAPLQVGQFEADNRLDAVLSKIWLEEGGGGSGQESYELAAYYYARHTKLAAHERGEKGFFFFLGDEGFYPQVDLAQVARIIGHEAPEAAPEIGDHGQPFPGATQIDAARVFAELQEKFHTFLIFPQKSMSERKRDIDAEIKQRVEAAGGRYEGVDIRASLVWNNRNDLDLHVIPPVRRAHLLRPQAFGLRRLARRRHERPRRDHQAGRERAVDPRRGAGGALPGLCAQLPLPRVARPDRVPRRGRDQRQGATLRGHDRQQGRDRSGQRDHDPRVRLRSPERVPEDPRAAATGVYANYADDVILRQWQSVLPAAHILKIEDPKAIVDVMLGVLAIVGGGSDLDTFLSDMQGREQLDLRRDQALQTLGALASATRMSQAQLHGTVPDGDARPGSRLTRL